MERTAVHEIDELEASEAEGRSVCRLPHLCDAGAEHAMAADVLTVLVVDVVRGIYRARGR